MERLAAMPQPLPESLVLYRDILAIQAEAEDAVSAPARFPASAFEGLNEGKPLLTWDKAVIDWKRTQATLGKIVALVKSRVPEAGKEMPVLGQMAIDLEYLGGMARRWFERGTAGRAAPDEEAAPGPVASSVLHFALHPYLAACADKLLPLIDQESWRRGNCPVCGAAPDMAYLDKENGARWLVCSRCDGSWLFQRLGCPFCLNDQPDSLGFFSNDQEQYRLYVCEKCRRYLKAVDLRKAGSDTILPLERVMTLDMDRQAQEKGYRTG